MLQQEFSLSDALAEVITGGEGGGGGGVEVTGGDIADSHTQYVFLVIEAMYNAAQGKVIKTQIRHRRYEIYFRQEQPVSSVTRRAVSSWTGLWRLRQ